MKISILLPYKENFSPEYPGAVSLFVHETSRISKFKKNIIVYGNTDFKKKFPIKYTNIGSRKNILSSQTKDYVKKFINLEKQKESEIIEIHNRPTYVKILSSEFKKKIISCLDHLSPEAESTQSVNTIYLKNNKIMGHNTDIIGFERAMQDINYKLSDKKILILGAGGVVASIIYALGKMQVSEIIISNRTKEKANKKKIKILYRL